MTDKLKPCPFCGGTEGEPCEEWEKAIKAWNTRPREDTLENENKRLREALEEILRREPWDRNDGFFKEASNIARQALNGDKNE